MSVDESVLGHGANGGPSLNGNRPSSMLARVSSSAAVLSSTGAAATGKTGSNATASGKAAIMGKDGKTAANAAPRRVLGDLSNANKVGCASYGDHHIHC